MKINEVTGQSKVTRNSGNEVEIDHGDGTTTTIDTKRNPNAVTRDERGRLKVQTNRGNSAQAQNKQRQQAPRPGEKIDVSDED